MHEPQLGEFEGLPALRKFAAEVGDWPTDAPDWKWSARFNYQVIERRGTGGANFRLLYSRFLDEVGETEGARLCVAAAEGWSPTAWHQVAEVIAETTAWSVPSIVAPGDPSPFHGTPALG